MHGSAARRATNSDEGSSFGLVHVIVIVIGSSSSSSSGQTFQVPFMREIPSWNVISAIKFGRSRIFIANHTALHFQFFTNRDDKLLDDFWILK